MSREETQCPRSLVTHIDLKVDRSLHNHASELDTMVCSPSVAFVRSVTLPTHLDVQCLGALSFHLYAMCWTLNSYEGVFKD